MPGARLPMRKIRDVLRLTAAGMSKRKIAASLSIGATTVSDFLQRARSAGCRWPLPEDMTDEALERLFPASTALAEIKARRPQPDWPAIHRELRRPGVTLQLLWEEYRAAHPDGYGYSRFCELYRAWEGRLSPTMRQTACRRRAAVRRLCRHDAGGDRRPDRRGDDGAAVRRRARRVQLHLCGGDLDAGARRLDRLAHPRFRILRRGDGAGGLRQPEVGHHQGVLLRAGGEPHLRRDGGALRHGDRSGAAQASRATRPRSRWRCWWRRAGSSPSCAIAASSRWPSLNAAIRELVTALNARVTRHLGTSRRALFDEIERPALKPLPAEPYRLRGMEGMPGRPRLSRRGRAALLLGAAHAAAREGVGAHHGAHRRGVPSRQARRRASAIVLGPPAHDGARAHAVEPPALCRLDAGADQAAGRRDRAQHRDARRAHPARAHAPRAGLPRLRRHPAAGQELRAPSGWRPPATGRSRSARAPTPPSTRS